MRINKINKRNLFLAMGLGAVSALADSPADWYVPTVENRPFVRWWWHGSAVDKEGLTYNLEEFAKKGLGGFEITPIYGVQGNEANDIPYLSDKWMDMLRHLTDESKRLGLQVDMNNGTGWPFGGPEVTTAESAQKQLISKYNVKGGQKLKAKIQPEDKKQAGVATVEKIMAFSGDKAIDVTDRLKKDSTLNWKAPRGSDWTIYALFSGRTFQKVKRAAPGGEGYVINHYDSVAVKKYLDRFDRAFKGREDLFPNTFFNDSYEVYGSDWTAGLLDEFFKDHGYRLENHLREFVGDRGTEAERGEVLRDYRYTLARMLRENFTEVWTRWAHSHGSRIRNQSHGSPANILDLYAIVDIPECETFGQSRFNIPGLHSTGPWRPNDGDPAALKFASSAAHLAGKPLTSAESLTWLTEHFNTSLALCKPEIDQMFSSGVNHIYFHGAPYSPKGVEFPGWLFYASINMSPTAALWGGAQNFFDYITRCQAFLTAGKPDSDLLLYFPMEDIWRRHTDKPYMMFSIHDMGKLMPEIKETMNTIVKSGYDADYLSDMLVSSLTARQDGTVESKGGNIYKAIVIPPVKNMPEKTRKTLDDLAAKGVKVIYSQDIVGDIAALDGLKPEPLRRDGVTMIRRRNEAGGWNYFVSVLEDKAIDGFVSLATPSESVVLFDPMTGERGLAESRRGAGGDTEVRLQLQPGQSVLIKTLPDTVDVEKWVYTQPAGEPLNIDKGWSISFMESQPPVEGVFETDSVTDWTKLDNPAAKVNTGTARYTVEFDLPGDVQTDSWLLDLGDVREYAVVNVNGQEAGTVWAVPYQLNVGKYLKPGKNRLDIDVTNLEANRMADFDRQGRKWKIFKDANVASVTNAKKVDFSDWETAPAGLNATPRLIPLKKQ